MRDLATLVLTSMIEHDQSRLPLAPRYRATENSVPGAIGMFTAWRLATRVHEVGLVVVDEALGSVVAVAGVELGGQPATVWFRLAVVGGTITELELYHTKSRGEAGYVMYPEEIGRGWPAAWTTPVDASARATRDELLHLGRAIFDTSLAGPASDPGCTLMENGGIVQEFVDFSDLMMGADSGPHDPEATAPMTGVGLDAFRPGDPDARVIAADVEQGIVVSIGVVRGSVMPMVTRAANISAFVPTSMVEMHARTLRPEWIAGRSVVSPAPVTCLSTQIWRIFDGKVQGVQMYNSLTGAGATPVWVD